MELRQLAYFDAVVRHGGFTRATEQLHVAQPAVSAQVRRLESELGTRLLQRTTRRVALTHEGELFHGRVRQILDQVDGARADLAELKTLVRGRVTIGATQVLGTVKLPAAMARFARRHPGVELALRTGLIAQLLDLLDRGEVDLIVGPIHHSLLDRYDRQILTHDGVVLISARGHRLPTDEPVQLSTVRDEPFVCLPAGSGLHTILVQAATAAGFVPRVAFETYSPASIRELVAAGLGLALVATSAMQAAGPAVHIHKLQPEPTHPPIGLISLRTRPLAPAAQTFAAALPRSAPEPGRRTARRGRAQR